MLKIVRDEEKIRIIADTNFDCAKFTWIDGIYFVVSNANISIWFDNEAEKKLRDFLRIEKTKKEE